MIQVVCADISGLNDADYEKLYCEATEERKNRADRYLRREDALRCVMADALLRHALGTDCYRTVQTADGKPCISDRPDFHYNLSHSGRWVILAFGDRAVGVDVEQIREETDIQAIAGRFFSAEEQQYVRGNPDQSRSRFFEVWTAKESFVKYLGKGLQKDLPTFSVFSPELGVRFYEKELEGGYWMHLCTEGDDGVLELLDVQQLW